MAKASWSSAFPGGAMQAERRPKAQAPGGQQEEGPIPPAQVAEEGGSIGTFGRGGRELHEQPWTEGIEWLPAWKSARSEIHSAIPPALSKHGGGLQVRSFDTLSRALAASSRKGARMPQ